ncbi:MAG: phospholipase D-like domain-containing protein [Lachnospiraceae bacterium]|nr:phospholipase D-like domain-containing protein [Lachnospiraceae bacterium]
MTKRQESHMRVEQKYNVGNSIGRIFFVAVFMTFQVWLMYAIITHYDDGSGILDKTIQLIALLIVLRVYGQHKNAANKMPWIILILIFPLLGILLWSLTSGSLLLVRKKKHFLKYDAALPGILPQNQNAARALASTDRGLFEESRYVAEHGRFPVYQGTSARYFPEAEQGRLSQIEDLRKAEHSIFLEYFAIEDRESFAPIREILYQKAAEGVDVRILYDDIGSASMLSFRFVKLMESHGIRCRDFNPISPFFSIFMNNRDHRKMTIIDGKIGYTGGYNLANEYFGFDRPYGHWKDTGVRLEGDAVRSMTAMFLEMWNAMRREDWTADLTKYLPAVKAGELTAEADSMAERRKAVSLPDDQTGLTRSAQLGRALDGKCFVQPYADTPMDEEQTGENVIMNILNTAQDYVWISTPYLVLSDEMSRALTLAAKRGVDVRILTPGIPDKKIVYQITRSYYGALVAGGVRIFEYTPGFNHAKMTVSDDATAVVGSINLDFRSLYLHFEDAVLFHGGQVVSDVKQDFEHIWSQSQEVTERYAHRGLGLRVWQSVLRLIAPLT